MWKLFHLDLRENIFGFYYASQGFDISKWDRWVIKQLPRVSKGLHRGLWVKQCYVTYLKNLTFQISDKDIEFSKQARWDQTTSKTTHRLDIFASWLMVQEKIQKWLLCSLRKSLYSCSNAATVKREKQICVARRGHKENKRKVRKMPPAVTCGAAGLSTALHLHPFHITTYIKNKHNPSQYAVKKNQTEKHVL